MTTTDLSQALLVLGLAAPRTPAEKLTSQKTLRFLPAPGLGHARPADDSATSVKVIGGDQ